MIRAERVYDLRLAAGTARLNEVVNNLGRTRSLRPLAAVSARLTAQGSTA